MKSSEYYGIYRGVVVDVDDPLKLGRCKIRVPSIHGSIQSNQYDLIPWASYISPMSTGNKRGMYLIPQVGDIVYVMFEGGNKLYPVYIGSSYGIVDGNTETPVDSLEDYKDTDVIYSSRDGAVSIKRVLDTLEITSGGSTMKITSDNSIEVSSNGTTYCLNSDGTANLSSSAGLNLSGPVNIGNAIKVDENGSVRINSDVNVSGSVNATSTVNEYTAIAPEPVDPEDPEYADDWLKCVQTVKKMLASMGVSYSQSTYVTYDFGSFKETVHPDCSGTVTAMIALYLNEKRSQWSSNNFVNNTSIPGFTKYSWPGWGGLNMGDIMAVSGHVEVFSHNEGGAHYVWNAGSTKSVQKPGVTRSGHDYYSVIWRPN